MRIGPRAKLLLLAALFLAPIAASWIAYTLVRPEATGNYGELLLPPRQVPAQPFARAGGGRFAFGGLSGQWVMVASGGGACDAACIGKLHTMQQVRLALGRRASRVARVFVADDGQPASAEASAFEGMIVAQALPGTPWPSAADRAHIHLVDPRGNVMMRWPAQPDMKRMLRDLDRLLRASQIG